MTSAGNETKIRENIQFHQMGLDDRLLKAIAEQGWKEPTVVQENAIPLVLEGKDVLARARTGSGKTAAFVIPLIHKILLLKQNAKTQSVTALILAPSKELCAQAHRNVQALSSSCSREVRCLDVSAQVSLNNQKPLLMEKPDIVIGTPSRILAHLQANNLELKSSLKMLIIDEADLVFSFGYETDIKSILSHLPKIFQAVLMSATLTEDVTALKKLVLHNPVILRLEEPQLPSTSQLTQYHIKCEEEDKFTLIYTLIKLHLIRGKSIVFVNTVDKCYRLKLFLEQFGIPSCALNSELPVNSRCHIVNQFNDGLYDIIIAADEIVLKDATHAHKEGKNKSKRKKDKEAGVARGIDFHNVTSVINFDFPMNVNSYIHRVGRTARAENEGTALSFVSVREMERLRVVEEALADTHPEGESAFKPFKFKMEEIEGFKYRAKDAMRAVTKAAVRDARVKEIKSEILNSDKLKSYFEDNPRDLHVLRHDKATHTVKGQQHLKHVPDYIIPPTLKGVSTGRVSKPSTSSQGRAGKKLTKTQMKYQKKQADPLKSFQFIGKLGAKKKKR